MSDDLMTQTKKNKKQDAIAARLAWEACAPALGLKQRRVSVAMGYSISYLTGALTGRNAWHDTLKLKFARALGKVPQQIWPDWPYAAMTCGQISDREYRIILFYRESGPVRQAKIDKFVECQYSDHIIEKTRKPS